MDAQKTLQLPMSEAAVRNLRVGDCVFLSGRIFTGRDCLHKYLCGNAERRNIELPDFSGGVIYHCGPVVEQKNGIWELVAAGPTTSSREEPYMAEIIEKHGLRAVIGKGGMGEKTLDACRRCGCVYLQAVGGAAQILASAVRRVLAVYGLEEFGAPEAVWEFEVENFPAVVTMDAHGGNLHGLIMEYSKRKLNQLLEK